MPRSVGTVARGKDWKFRNLGCVGRELNSIGGEMKYKKILKAGCRVLAE